MLQITKILLFGLFFTVISCTDQDTNSVQPEMAENHYPSWEVSYSQSGGFTGQMINLVINHEGKIIDEDLKLRKKTINQLSQNDIKEFYKLLISFKNNKTSTTPQLLNNFKGKNCRDCLNSSLKIKFDDGIYSVSQNNKLYNKIISKMVTLNKHAQNKQM